MMVRLGFRALQCVALCAVLALPARAVAAGPTRPADALDDCVQSEMASKGIYGAQLAVAVDGEVVLNRAYGRKHRDMADPVDVHTQFRIGSTTKPMTEYLRGFQFAEPGQAERITVRDLLRHTSGLHDNSAIDESDLFGPTDPGALGRWVDAQNGVTAPYAPPGRFWNYSSANYMYLGRILELVTGMSYQDYVDDNVFAPAGMDDSTLHAEEAVARGDFAYGHYQNPFSGRLEIYTLNDANNWARAPTGYVNSTAADLVRFASLFMDEGGGVLSPASTVEMQTRQTFRDLRADQYYGLGTFIEYFDGHEMVHHDGGAWGWTATLKWLPDAHLAVGTVANIGSASLSSSTTCALRAYSDPLPTKSPPCGLDRARWSDYVGTYEGTINTGAPITFLVTRPDPSGALQLRVERPGKDPYETPLDQDCGRWLGSGPGSFYAGSYGEITFIADRVDPGTMWLRNRFFVGERAAATPTPEPSATPQPAPRVFLPFASS